MGYSNSIWRLSIDKKSTGATVSLMFNSRAIFLSAFVVFDATPLIQGADLNTSDIHVHGWGATLALTEATNTVSMKQGALNDSSPDVDDSYTESFTPVEVGTNLVGIHFFVDTSQLNRANDCLTNRRYCKDFITMFGSSQEIIGTAYGDQYVTTAGKIETGEDFHFTERYKHWDDITNAIHSGKVSFIIHTNMREHDDPAYSIASFTFTFESK